MTKEQLDKILQKKAEEKKIAKKKFIIDFSIKAICFTIVLIVMVIYIQELLAVGHVRVARDEACVKILADSGLVLSASSNPSGGWVPTSCIGKSKTQSRDGVMYDKTREYEQYINDNQIGLDNPKYGMSPWAIGIFGASTNN